MIIVERVALRQIRSVLRDHRQIVAVVGKSQAFDILPHIHCVHDAGRVAFEIDDIHRHDVADISALVVTAISPLGLTCTV